MTGKRSSVWEGMPVKMRRFIFIVLLSIPLAIMFLRNFSILLAHRPELLPVYASLAPELVFAGHAHGGQFRLPFLGGLIAPGQGLFPKYTAGVYQEAATTMVVSRGLGNSIISQRLFNRPEVVVVTLN